MVQLEKAKLIESLKKVMPGVEKGNTRHTCHDTYPCMTSMTVNAIMKNFAISLFSFADKITKIWQ